MSKGRNFNLETLNLERIEIEQALSDAIRLGSVLSLNEAIDMAKGKKHVS